MLRVSYDQIETMDENKRLQWAAKYKVGVDYEIIDGLCFAISSLFIFKFRTENWHIFMDLGFIDAVKNFVSSIDTMSSSLQTAYFESYYNEESLQGNLNCLSSIQHMNLSAEYLNSNCKAVYARPRFPVLYNNDQNKLSISFYQLLIYKSPVVAMIQHGAGNDGGHAVVFGFRRTSQRFFLFDPNYGLYIISPWNIIEFMRKYFHSYSATWCCLIDC